MPLQLLDLNDDVLYRIADELHGANALRFSLVSKRTHEAAIHRVPAVVICRPNDKLPLHRQYLLDGPQPRAQHVEEFVAARISMVRYRELVDPQEPASEDIAFIIDLISNAPNLRRITLPEVSRLMERHPRLKDSLLSLRKLSHVKFGGVGVGPAMDFLRSTGWNLSVLSLDYLDDFRSLENFIGDPLRPHQWPPLLDTLAAFPRLRTLQISSFYTSLSFGDIGNITPPAFPALRELCLRSAFSALLDLAYLAPNLHTLSYEMVAPWFDHVSSVPARPGPTLPALRSVMFNTSGSVRCAELRLGVAYHLRIAVKVRCHDPDADAEQAERLRVVLTALRKVSPVWAQIPVTAGGRPMEFWKQVAAEAPRLRYLELKVYLAALDSACASWLDNVPGALASLPLVGLRLHLGRMPIVQLQIGDDPEFRRFDSPVYLPQRELAKRLYRERRSPTESRMRSFFVPASEGVDDHKDDLDWYAYQDAWYTDVVKTLEWWRVIRDGDEIVRLDALTADQGRRVQRFFENADVDAVARIDDFISEL